MTGDPLAWIADRGEAWAATTLTKDVLELDVYVLLPALRRELEARDGDLSAAVAHWAAPAMHAGLKYELVIAADDYLDRLVAGKLPRLLPTSTSTTASSRGRRSRSVRRGDPSGSARCRTSSRRPSAASTSTAAPSRWTR